MCPSGRLPVDHHTTPTTTDFRPAFDILDTDQDGKISSDDLRTFFSTKGGLQNEVEIQNMISAADVNKDGFVEFDEFNKVLDCGNKPNGVMEDVFKVMDRDGDGQVGFDDLMGYMKMTGFDATEEDIKGMIKLGGGDDNNGVCFDGLVKIFAVEFGQEF